jgi:hypothetical protein
MRSNERDGDDDDASSGLDDIDDDEDDVDGVWNLLVRQQDARSVAEVTLPTLRLFDFCLDVQSHPHAQKYSYSNPHFFRDIYTGTYANVMISKADLVTLCGIYTVQGNIAWSDFQAAVRKLGGKLNRGDGEKIQKRRKGSQRTLLLPIENARAVRVDEPHGRNGDVMGRWLVKTIREALLSFGLKLELFQAI